MPWNEVGTCCDVSCLTGFMCGQMPPPEEVKEGDILKQTDIGVKRITKKDEGLALPWSFYFWHWGMVLAFGVIYFIIFILTTPLDTTASEGFLVSALGLPPTFPYFTFAQKLMVFWYAWEALGLGVLHGPMHGKMKPPFTDWWYRLTPGTIKWRGPFMPDTPFFNTRNIFDVLVEGILTHVCVIYIIIQREVLPSMMLPIFACALYEFIFDYGQHMSTYGTQILHVFACMCFTVDQGQVVGVQVCLTWFYFCSGWCKQGPWFKYLNVANLMTAKFMVATPWAGLYRRLMYKDPESETPDYNLTSFAKVLSFIFAWLETAGPALCLVSSNEKLVALGILIFVLMHIYIIATLIVDVFTWNFVDAVYYVIMFGVLGTGFQWGALSNLNPYLAAWLGLHMAYSIYGNFVPSHVPYVVAHRHAAGNFSQGMLLIKPSAAAKLGKLKAHAGLPSALDPMNEMGLRWLGQWLAVHLLVAYFWLWNLPSRFLVPLIHKQLNGQHMNEFIMIHSVLLFDALLGHVRFDGLSGLQLVLELGRVCEFEEGECTLCWVGAFQSFPVWPLSDPTAKWKVVDAKKGILKEGLMKVSDVENADYKKPSDCGKLLDMIEKTQPLLSAC